MTEAKFTPGYEVTADGRVFSVGSDWRGYGRREMTQEINASGYPSVRITVSGRRVRVAVHKLVALHHLPPKPFWADQIRHLDGDNMNPRASNLAWGTAKENAQDRETHGRTARGTALSAAIRSGMAASQNPYYRHARGQKT